MKKKVSKKVARIFKDPGYWAFAIINGRLTEMHFTEKKGVVKVWGHCYVVRKEYTTKIEQKMIDNDIKKFRFVYRNKKYRSVV